MAGILAIWNDCAPEGYDHFERRYIREHLQERVGVPGFRFGRRYEAVSGADRRFFASHAVVLRADGAMAPTPEAAKLVEGLAAKPGVARVQLWTAAARQTPTDTAEMKSRGKDQLTAGALVVECLRRTDAERIAAALAAPQAALGVSASASSASMGCCASTPSRAD